MASYFNLTLDTVAPSGLTASLNDDALYTTSTAVILKTSIGDADPTGYQMKVWGIEGAEDEASASWEAFTAEKSINLTTGDGLKTVHIKVRDDVWNESAEVTETITLNTVVPVVTITGPDVTRVSKIDGKDEAVVSFVADVAFIAYKVCLVPATNSLESAGTVIPTTGGSVNVSGEKQEGEDPFTADTPISVTINGIDLEAVGADGSGSVPSVLKVFVQNVAGTWSVA